MEEQNKFLKLLYLVAFVALAGVSCWATAESLHMLLESFPYAFCWVITIAFFIIASFGTKLIVDSLNQNVYVEKRGAKLILGIVITLVFWLVCSMPTNTHTFFYRSVANSIAMDDIQTTLSFLNQLVEDTNTETKIKDRQNELDNKVNAKLIDLETEIQNDANPGFGPNAQEILRQFAKLLNVDKVESISYKSTSVQQRGKLVDLYRKKIYELTDTRKKDIRTSMTAVSRDTYQHKAQTDIKNLKPYLDMINSNPSALNDVTNAHTIDNRLLAGYATIKIYNDFICFQSESDKDKYVTEHPITKLKRLMSVFDVWHDVLTGQYKGHGFIFWILISILVDIAAFIFFDLTFKKRED